MKLACSKAGDKAAMCVERTCPELINKKPTPLCLMSLADVQPDPLPSLGEGGLSAGIG